MKIIAQPNKTKTGFSFKSKYTYQLFLDWLKKFKEFEIRPIRTESRKARGYLEGAIIPAYCHWQYGIDPRDRRRHEQRRFLFKRDFNYEIVNNRQGKPVRSPISSQGKAVDLANKYTEWAEQNGAPIPNPELYKLWRDEYSDDPRFPTFFEFLDFLGIECDAMPSGQTLKKLEESQPKIEYPDDKNLNPDKIPF